MPIQEADHARWRRWFLTASHETVLQMFAEDLSMIDRVRDAFGDLARMTTDTASDLLAQAIETRNAAQADATRSALDKQKVVQELVYKIKRCDELEVEINELRAQHLAMLG